MGRDYAFVTLWRLEAPVERVWDTIVDSLSWPRWWPYVESVVDLSNGATGIGAVRRYTWTSRLPYRLAFESRLTRLERPHLLEGEASGELCGTGLWRLTAEEPSITTVRYDWTVRTTKPWMNLVAPLARPIFDWNHDQVMRAGGMGLARHLGVRLLSSSDSKG